MVAASSEKCDEPLSTSSATNVLRDWLASLIASTLLGFALPPGVVESSDEHRGAVVHSGRGWSLKGKFLDSDGRVQLDVQVDQLDHRRVGLVDRAHRTDFATVWADFACIVKDGGLPAFHDKLVRPA